MKERYLRLELSDLELMLKETGRLEPSEMLNDAHIEPNELVIRVLKEGEDANKMECKTGITEP